MKKILKKIMFVALAAMTFTACEDVPEPYDLPDNGSNVVNPGEDGTLPYVSSNLNAGWTILAITPEQPWSLGSSYVQATGYQKWDGAEEKSNRAVEGWLISPAVNTTDADSVKISFEQTIRYTSNVSGWAEYHKIYASDNYDGTNFDAATWMPVTFTPVASPYNDWTLYSSGEIQLPQEMAGKAKVHVAFWFKAPATASTTWELKNFRMEKGQAHANVTPEEETIGTAEEPITVADALAKTNALEDGAKSSSKAYVKGKVVKVTTNQTNFEKYGNITYYISDDGSDNNSIQVYAGDGLNGEKFTSVSDIAAGDEVVVLGTLYKYVNKNSGAVVPEIEGSYLVSLVKGTPQPGGEAKGTGTLEDPFNAVAANNEAAKLAKSAVSEKSFYIKGKVAKIALDKNNNVQNFDFGGYGNASFYISDDGNDANTFYCYRVLYLENSEWAQGAGPVLKVNDEVIVCAKLTNYNGTYETQQKEGYLYSLNGTTKRQGGGGGGGDNGSIDAPNTVAQALTVINGLADGATTSDFYFVKGKIAKIATAAGDIGPNSSSGKNYKDINYYISDDGSEGSTIYVYRGKNLNNTDFTSADQLRVGDEVIVYGKLQKYKNSNSGDIVPEMAQGNYIVKIDRTGGGGQGGGGGQQGGTGSLDAPNSVAQALSVINGLADGATTSDSYYVKGKVAKIATAAGDIGSKYTDINYYISDDGSEGSTLYVYRGKNLNNTDFTSADQLGVGDEVIVYGKLQKYKNSKTGDIVPEMAQGNYIVKIDHTSGGGQGGGGDQGGGGGDQGGAGSYSQPYNVAAVIANGTSNTVSGVYVKGYIVGWVDGQVLASGAQFNGNATVKTNLLIADNASETDVTKCVPVQLPNNAVRTGLNLQDNSQYYGKEVLLYGNLEKYFGAAGVKGVTYAECGGNSIGSKP